MYIEYTGYVKGRPYKGLQNIETDFELGSNTFLEDFEKKFIGVYEYERLCYDFAQQCGYNSIEHFTKDNGADYLQEKVYEKIVKDYLFAIALQIDKKLSQNKTSN